MNEGTKETLKMVSVMAFFVILIGLLTFFLKTKNPNMINTL